MEVKGYIETFNDKENWENYLLNHSKEKLVDLIIDKMLYEPKFCEEVYNKLIIQKSSINESIEWYITAINDEMDNRRPEVEILDSLSRTIMKTAESEKTLFDQVKVYTAVIISLNEAIDGGAGMEDDSDFVLAGIMDECRTSMLSEIERKVPNLSADDLGKVQHYLEDKSNEFNPIDGDNRIDTALEKLMTLTKGRTRVNRSGGYVRGAEYYRSLGKRN